MSPMKRRLMFPIAVLGLVAIGCEDAATTQELKPIPIGMMGAMNTPFITPPVIAPPTFKANEVTLPDSTIVIGVNAGGHAKCYVKEVMQPIASHVVNDTIGLTPVSITYCDQKDFVRVFRGTETGQTCDVKVGGYMNDEMALMIGGTMFGQSSKDIPLPDAEFQQVTWGEWKAAHPETRIYLGYLADQHAPKLKQP